MPSAADLRKLGRDALAGNWLLAVFVTLLAALLGGISYFSFGSVSADHVMYWSVSTRVFFSLYGIFVFIIGGAVELGLCCFYIHLQRQEEISVSDLFSRFSIFGRAFLLRLYIFILVLLWTLLLIIPGIVAAYRYAMAPYLMSQNPELGVMQAVDISKRMMNGHKGRLFCLDLSFIGWFILGILTFGLGLLFVFPYLLSSRAAFFLDLRYHYQEEMDGDSATKPASASTAEQAPIH